MGWDGMGWDRPIPRGALLPTSSRCLQRALTKEDMQSRHFILAEDIEQINNFDFFILAQTT